MSDERFTRDDWRPGKRRRSYPRVRDWGGRKSAPAAFLAMAPFVGLASDKAARCRHCKRVAMRGLPVCRFHGGARWAAQRRPYATRRKPDGVPAP